MPLASSLGRPISNGRSGDAGGTGKLTLRNRSFSRGDIIEEIAGSLVAEQAKIAVLTQFGENGCTVLVGASDEGQTMGDHPELEHDVFRRTEPEDSRVPLAEPAGHEIPSEDRASRMSAGMATGCSGVVPSIEKVQLCGVTVSRSAAKYM